ncbi:MAG: methyl-accepting chemotaxis protein [Candidatus Sulfotelmatobacter sp.]
MNRLGLKLKLAVGFGLLLGMLVALGGSAYYASLRVKAVTQEANDDQDKERHTILIDTAVRKQIQAANEYAFNGDTAALPKYAAAKQDVEQRLAAIKKILITAKGKEIVSRFEKSAKQVSALTDQEIAFRQASHNYEATDMAFGLKEVEAIKEVSEVAAELEDREEKRAQTSLDAEHVTEAKANFVTLCLVIGGLVVGALAAILIAGSISRSMAQMLGMAEQVAARNLAIADLKISSRDEIGKTEKALNTMKNGLREMIHAITATATRVTGASQQISTETQQIMANSEETSAQANLVSSAVQQVTRNLQTVVAGAGEMSTTIQSIATSARDAAAIASEAVKSAQVADATVTKLGQSSAEINDVIKVITSIAQQTNLLALNATIEAARAGEAGKGFAVVANEVKELAKQTAKATEDITRKISAIQQDSRSAVDAIGSIHGVIHKISDISGTIATAVEEQSATTNEMSRNVAEASARASEISSNISGVAQAAQGTSTNVRESQKAAEQLAEMSAELSALVAQFKIDSNDADASVASKQPHTLAAAASA